MPLTAKNFMEFLTHTESHENSKHGLYGKTFNWLDVVSKYGVSYSSVRTQIIIIIIIIISHHRNTFLTSMNAHSPQRNFVQKRNKYCLEHDNSFHFRRAKAIDVCK